MSVPKKETAEEQLLRLIEGAKGPNPQIAGPPMPVPPLKSPLRERIIHALQQQLFALRFRLAGFFQSRQRGGDTVLQQLQLASRILWVVLLCFGVYLVFQVIQDRANQKPAIPHESAPAQPGAAMAVPPSPDALMRPMADYLSAILQRNPFTGTSGSNAAAPVMRAREKLEALTGSLVVVGIDRGAKPEALIEDKDGGRTYFVKVGDVVNGAFVKEISANGVIVEYEGEEKLLR